MIDDVPFSPPGEPVGPQNPINTPVVFVRDGGVYCTSRDVASYFAKRHDHVVRSIDELIGQEPALLGQGIDLPKSGEMSGGGNFYSRTYIDDQNRNYRQYEMDRDGFVLLAMAFQGEKALKFKRSYIAAFNMMEQELRRQAAERPAKEEQLLKMLDDPSSLRKLLLTFSEKVQVLERKVIEQEPKVAQLRRIEESEGSLCITDAAKTLKVNPGVLFKYLRTNGWTYFRPNTNTEIAFQSKIIDGFLEHKVSTLKNVNGWEKTVFQIRVTGKGLVRLAKIFGPIIQPAQAELKL